MRANKAMATFHSNTSLDENGQGALLRILFMTSQRYLRLRKEPGTDVVQFGSLYKDKVRTCLMVSRQLWTNFLVRQCWPLMLLCPIPCRSSAHRPLPLEGILRSCCPASREAGSSNHVILSFRPIGYRNPPLFAPLTLKKGSYPNSEQLFWNSTLTLRKLLRR